MTSIHHIHIHINHPKICLSLCVFPLPLIIPKKKKTHNSSQLHNPQPESHHNMFPKKTNNSPSPGLRLKPRNLPKKWSFQKKINASKPKRPRSFTEGLLFNKVPQAVAGHAQRQVALGVVRTDRRLAAQASKTVQPLVGR